jgi:uncharacterized protein (TIGR03067 family)
MVDAEYDGLRNPGQAKEYSWDFHDYEYTNNHNDNFMELYHVKLSSGRKPKTIDATHDLVGRKLMGIYEISGDRLKVCYDLTGNGRPDSFEAAKGSRRACYYFQRR